jgi:methionyl-tRNA formyltransferase
VVAAYGLILPGPMLDAPRLGCLNIHASLLPRWRGAAPIQAAILAGDTETGSTIMRMDEGLDTGPMLLRDSVPIGPRATTPALHDALAAMGAALIVRALAGPPTAGEPQPDQGATYAAKLTREDGRLDFSQDACALDRRVRALTPWPGTTARFAGEVLKVIEAEPVAAHGAPGAVLDPLFTVACGRGALRLRRVQRAGRPALAGDAFLRGIAGWRDAFVT